LKPAQSAADVIDDTVDQTGSGERRLWINTVSREVWEGVGERERKRQENINEAIYTERDFVKDLEYLRDVSLPLEILLMVVLDYSVDKVGYHSCCTER
jgi:hypothetical protein